MVLTVLDKIEKLISSKFIESTPVFLALGLTSFFIYKLVSLMSVSTREVEKLVFWSLIEFLDGKLRKEAIHLFVQSCNLYLLVSSICQSQA